MIMKLLQDYCTVKKIPRYAIGITSWENKKGFPNEKPVYNLIKSSPSERI